MYRKFFIVLALVLLLANIVEAVGEEEASLAIGEAENTIREMQQTGFGVTYANDTLNEAKNLFVKGYYEASEALAKKVIEIRERAEEVNELIDRVESKIYELSSDGYDVSSARVIFDSGISEFAVDNYLDAEKIMSQTLNKLDGIEAEESLKRIQKTDFDIFSFIFDYLWLLITVILILLVGGGRFKRGINVKKCRNEVEKLERESQRINKFIAEAQRKYFEKSSISRSDYDLLMKRHNFRLSVIKRRVAFLKGELKSY